MCIIIVLVDTKHYKGIDFKHKWSNKSLWRKSNIEEAIFPCNAIIGSPKVVVLTESELGSESESEDLSFLELGSGFVFFRS